MSAPLSLRVGFEHRGLPGEVAVEVGVNDDPAALGCGPHALGFPWCRAEVSHPARGYDAALGWVQVVRSNDQGGEFAPDPFEPLGELPHPFAFFGFAPTFFDAPSREERADLKWLAHAFLCAVPAPGVVTALAGFAWGFELAGGELTRRLPAALGGEAWEGQERLLAGRFPSWSFQSDIAQRPGDPV